MEEFKELRKTQAEKTIDISDPTGSVDGQLLREYLDDGMTPAQALVLLIKERAAEYSEN